MPQKSKSDPEDDVKAALTALVAKQRNRGVVDRVMPYRDQIVTALTEGVTYKELFAVFTEKGVIESGYENFCSAMAQFRKRVGLPTKRELKAGMVSVSSGGGDIEAKRRLAAAAPTVTDMARARLDKTL